MKATAFSALAYHIYFEILYNSAPLEIDARSPP